MSLEAVHQPFTDAFLKEVKEHEEQEEKNLTQKKLFRCGADTWDEFWVYCEERVEQIKEDGGATGIDDKKRKREEQRALLKARGIERKSKDATKSKVIITDSGIF